MHNNKTGKILPRNKYKASLQLNISCNKSFTITKYNKITIEDKSKYEESYEDKKYSNVFNYVDIIKKLDNIFKQEITDSKRVKGVYAIKNGELGDEKIGTTSNIFSWQNLEKGATYTAKAAYKNEVGPYAGMPTDIVTFTVPNENTTIEKTIKLEAPVKVDPNVPIVLRNINFDLGKWAIRPDAEPQLNQLVRLMTDFPEITNVELSAHTDVRGSAPSNQRLSQKRAQSAVNYLISKGVDPSRITSVGKGETEVINKCVEGVTCTNEEHEVNRRVEFKILEGPNSIPASYFK